MNKLASMTTAATILAVAGTVHGQGFTEGFDDVMALTTSGGWFTQNNSAPIGILNYFQGNTSVFAPHASAGYLAANYESVAGANTISNWFVTPQLSGIQNGHTFSFYTRTVSAPFAADRLQVRMSLAGASTNVGPIGNPTAVGDFTALLLDINPAYLLAGPGSYPTEWTHFSVTVSGVPTPTSGRFAFRYFVQNGGPMGSNSDYIGIDSVEYSTGMATTGACCLPDGSCLSASAFNCVALGGIYQGNGSACGSVQCAQPPTGACCISPIDLCVLVSEQQCAALNGVWMKAGSDCSSCSSVAVIYTNCNLNTGPTTLSGVAAPPGFEWSECARDSADPLTANSTAGFGGSGSFRLADDFVVPAGGIHLAYLKVYAYTPGAIVPGVTAATLRILDGSPLGSPNVVFGDQTTDRLAKTEFAKSYRVFNSVAPTVGCVGAGTAPGTSRRLQEIYIRVNQTLPAGTYWIDFNYTGASFSPPSTRVDAIGRQCDPQNSNALQFDGAWVPVNDAGQGCAPVPLTQDIYFELLGTAVGCYANCDGSTIAPILNVNDFACFLNRFAASEPYANCDGSTTPPILNVNDFACFLNSFAAGCP